MHRHATKSVRLKKVLLDVRTPDEFQAMQLPYDVVHIPLGALREKLNTLTKDKDILAFCKVSLRGYEAQRILNGAGFDRVHYSSAVLPGAMFLLGYTDQTAIMGLPACGLYHRTTIFDLILPRLIAEEKPGARDLAKLGHGGLCLNCDPCVFPQCPFGKSS